VSVGRNLPSFIFVEIGDMVFMANPCLQSVAPIAAPAVAEEVGASGSVRPGVLETWTITDDDDRWTEEDARELSATGEGTPAAPLPRRSPKAGCREAPPCGCPRSLKVTPSVSPVQSLASGSSRHQSPRPSPKPSPSLSPNGGHDAWLASQSARRRSTLFSITPVGSPRSSMGARSPKLQSALLYEPPIDGGREYSLDVPVEGVNWLVPGEGAGEEV